MKVKNIFICILNLIEVLILALLTETVLDYIHVYSLYMFILRIVWYTVGIFNIVYGIINIKKKNSVIGIFFIIIGIINLAMILINHTEIFDSLDYEIAQILNYISLGISGIFSIIIIIINKNLENDNKNKGSLIIFIIITLINMFTLSFISIIHFSNINNFQKYISAMQSADDTTTYILDCLDECIFLDENGQEISRKDYKSIFTHLQFKINGKISNIIDVTTNDGKAILTTNTGEELFTMNTGIPIDNLGIIINSDDSDMLFSKNTVLTSFLYYIANSGNYNFERTNSFVGFQNIILNYNVLNKYNEANKEFEDNADYLYLYFKNNNISNYTLQVVITNTTESDNNILNLYSENCEHYRYIDFNKMENFYNYRKEFYLIDFDTNTKIKLDCSNLFYEAIDNDERIILLSNGYIPFYDKDENGYFNFQGQKVTVASNYILYDVVDDNIIIMDKQTNKTLVLSSENNSIIKELDYPLTRYNGFYIAHSDGTTYDIIFDNNFNIVISGSSIKLIGDKFISLATPNYNTYIYQYGENGISKLNVNSNSKIISLISSNNSTVISSNIYSNIGIIAPANNW